MAASKGTFWWHVRITGPANPDKLSAVLFGMDATGLSEDPAGVSAYFNAVRFSSEADAAARLTEQLDPSLHMEVSRQPAEDWESGWKRHFKPIRVSARLVVRPSWHTYRRRPKETVIVIDPKMAFGTGTHESTRLALRLLEPCARRTSRVLDVGTGSGILTIAALKLGARRAFAFDIDGFSIENARENLRRNRCQDRTRLRLGSAADMPVSWPKSYELILANIQRTVITDLLPMLHDRLAPQGTLIVSGLLLDETETMRRSFAASGLAEIDRLTEGEWAAFALRRAP